MSEIDEGKKMIRELNAELASLVKDIKLKGIPKRFKQILLKRVPIVNECIRNLESELKKEEIIPYAFGKTIGRVEGVLSVLLNAEEEE